MANEAQCKTTSHSPGKQMDDEHREILQNVRERLLIDMEASKVLENMSASNVFSPDDRDEIKSTCARKQQCETLLDMLPRRGAKAYDVFINALTKGNQKFLADVVKQEEIKVLGCRLSNERVTSAGLKGQVQDLKVRIETEKKEREKLVEELNKLKGLLEIKELGPELSKERETSAGLKGRVQDLETVLENEKEKREKLEEEFNKLKILLGEQKVNAVSGTNRLRDEQLQNSNSKLKDSLAEEGGATKCAVDKSQNFNTSQKDNDKQTDVNNHEKNELFSTYVQGSGEVAQEGKRCPQCYGLKKEIETSKTEIETLQDIFSQLERKNMEVSKLLEEAKNHTGEISEKHKNRIPEVVTDPRKTEGLYIESDFKKIIGLHEQLQEEKGEQPRAKGTKNKQKRRNHKDNESRSMDKAVKLDQEKIMKTLRQEKEKERKEKEDKITELKDVKTERDQLKQKTIDDGVAIENLHKKVNEWKKKSETLEDEIAKSRTFVNCVLLPCGNSAGVIRTLMKNGSNKVVASRSTDGPGNVSDVLSHQNKTICGTEEKSHSWWDIALGENYRLFVTHFAVRYGNIAKCPILGTWQLKGSSDGRHWTTLNKTVKTDLKNGLTTMWLVDGKVEALRYFRIDQTGLNSKGTFGIFLTGVELYGVLLELRH